MGIAALIVLAVFLAQPLLVIFGGVVFASLIEGGQRLLGRVIPARALRIALVLLAAVGFLVWLGYFAGSQIAAQAAQFPHIIQGQAQRTLTWLQAMASCGPGPIFEDRRAGDRRGRPGHPCAGRAVRRVHHVLPDRDPGHLFRARARHLSARLSWMFPLESRRISRSRSSAWASRCACCCSGA
jgi:hypothetical protein